MNWLDIPRVARQAFVSTKKNAAKREIPFSLSKGDMARMWEDCGGKCAVSRVPLDTESKSSVEWRRNPWRASIDRIDSSKGYELTNCRIVCVAANIALNEWGVDVLRRLAHGMFGSDESPVLSKAGTGYLRGIGRKLYKGQERFDVRLSVNGKLRGFGTFSNYEDAVRRLEAVKAEFRSSSVTSFLK